MDAKLMTFVIMVMWSQVRARGDETPPSVLPWQNPQEYFRSPVARTVACVATGNPKPTFTWLYEDKRGVLQEVQTNNMVHYSKTSGVLSLTSQFDASANANYTCIASNKHGKAMTRPLTIQDAFMSSFPGNSGQLSEVRTAFESQYLKIPCKNADKLISRPPMEIIWKKGNWEDNRGEGPELKTSKLVLGDNMALDPDGTLHFLWVKEKDFGFVYVCTAFNKEMLSTHQNTHSVKLQSITGTKNERKPMKAYISDVTAMAGTTAKLVCIFSYYSRTERLKITWRFRGEIVGEGQELSFPVTVPNTKVDQSGFYMCEAQLGSLTEFGRVRLTIISPPTWNAGEQLLSTTAPVDKDVVFRCGTDSYQTYQEAPVWYVNADKLLDCEDPSEMVCPERKGDGSIKCVPQCDGFPDCEGDEDENGCGTMSCKEDKKLCKGTCIAQTAPCEPDSTCVWPFFECKDKSGCIKANARCNNVTDCADGSDEEFCPGRTPIQVQGFTVSSDRTSLTLPKVQVDDQMCFQCSVKNQHGLLFGDGCLTVIDKLEIQFGPNDTYNVEPNMYINIGVDATTKSKFRDQISFNWIWYNETQDADGNDIIDPVKIQEDMGPLNQYFRIRKKGKNMTIIIPDVTQEERDKGNYDDYVLLTKSRRYAVNISQPYETVFLNFTVIGVEITPPIKEEVVTQASLNLWFIALILAVLVLFVVIALIVCYMYRNRGGTYPLDKKEHQAGHDPAQELKDAAFHDVGRVDDEYDDDKQRPDQVSLSESVKPYESDDDMTGEYEGDDLDLSRFNEEGSFIFQYGDKKNKAKEVTV